MKKITFKNLVNLLKSNGLLAVAGGLLLMSCGSQMGYTETDGVYYDPSRDTLPEGTVMNSGNRVGEYYDYQATENRRPLVGPTQWPDDAEFKQNVLSYISILNF